MKQKLSLLKKKKIKNTRVCVSFARLYASSNYLGNNLEDDEQKQQHSKVCSKKHILTTYCVLRLWILPEKYKA